MRLCCRASDGAPLQEPLGLQIALLNIQAWNLGKLLAYQRRLESTRGRGAAGGSGDAALKTPESYKR